MRLSPARVLAATLLLTVAPAQALADKPSDFLAGEDQPEGERSSALPGGARGARGDASGSEPAPLPDVRWFTLQTPHFRVHFYENERAIAHRSAIVAERAYRLLTRYLNWLPS